MRINAEIILFARSCCSLQIAQEDAYLIIHWHRFLWGVCIYIRVCAFLCRLEYAWRFVCAREYVHASFPNVFLLKALSPTYMSVHTLTAWHEPQEAGL